MAVRGLPVPDASLISEAERVAEIDALLEKLAHGAAVVSTIGPGAPSARAAERRVLIAVTNHARLGISGEPTGSHLSEVTQPYFLFTAAGLQVDFVSPNGGPAPVDPTSQDFTIADNRRFGENPELRARLNDTLAASSVQSERYVGIYLAGGHGAMWDFPESEPLARLIATIYERGGVVGAVCHGPSGLLNVRLSKGEFLVAGREVATLTDEEEALGGRMDVVPFLLETMLKTRGARISKVAPWQSHVAVDGHLVTGQNPQSVVELVGRFLALVGK